MNEQELREKSLDEFALEIGLIKHRRPSMRGNSYVVYSTPPTDIGNYVDIEPLHLMMIRPLITQYGDTREREGRIDEQGKKLTLAVDSLVVSKQYAEGFNAAIEAVNTAKDKRLAELKEEVRVNCYK